MTLEGEMGGKAPESGGHWHRGELRSRAGPWAHPQGLRLLGIGIGGDSGKEDRDLGGWAWSEAA